VIVGSYGVNGYYVLVDNPDYPEIVEDNRRTFAMARDLSVDYFLGAHPSIYGMWGKYEKLLTQDKNAPSPFIDPDGYLAYIDVQEQIFEKMLQAENAVKNQASEIPAIAMRAAGGNQ